MKKILIKPILTEKTYSLASDLNQYTFEVTLKATKDEVNRAVREKFGVEVIKIRIINKLGRSVSFGKTRIPGKRKNQKKAIVTLKKGDKIDLFEMK